MSFDENFTVVVHT